MSRLQDFLKQKPLYYNEIDIERMPKAYEAVREHLTVPKIVHIIGTNGKGTTGRFLAKALLNEGLSVGHYSSPHILKFSERIWLNGEDASDDLLQKSHEKLLTFLPPSFQDSLSYFEYTTLLAMVVFEICDYVVLEAGLGGEHDATSVFPKELSVVTPIGLDHQDFLGNLVEDIARTKLRSVTNRALISNQQNREVYEIAQEIAELNSVEISRVEDVVTSHEMSIAKTVIESEDSASYLTENLMLAMAAIKLLGFSVKKSGFRTVEFFGRMSRVSHNITVDVGHNSLAANAIVQAVTREQYVLIYNSYRDKDYGTILAILRPIIKRVEILPINDERIVERATLEKSAQKLGLKIVEFRKVLQSEEYLVFGSFRVVEEFMKKIG